MVVRARRNLASVAVMSRLLTPQTALVERAGGLILRHTRPVQPDETAAATRVQLERVLASDAFVNAGRLSRLLRFLVEHTLDGHADDIKEFLVGTEVFDRGPTYDPRLDSIVRVEMRRLRTKLDEYYAGPGVDDPIVIKVRRGSYVPMFEMRHAEPLEPIAPAVVAPALDPGAATAESGQPIAVSSTIPRSTPGLDEGAASPARSGARSVLWAAALLLLVAAGTAHLLRTSASADVNTRDSRVAVLPFAIVVPDEDLRVAASVITGAVTSELVRRGTFEVVPRSSAAQFPDEPRVLHEVADALNARWLVEAMVHREHGGLRVEARLADSTLNRKLWVENFRGTGDNLTELSARIAEAVEAVVER